MCHARDTTFSARDTKIEKQQYRNLPYCRFTDVKEINMIPLPYPFLTFMVFL